MNDLHRPDINLLGVSGRASRQTGIGSDRISPRNFEILHVIINLAEIFAT